MGKGWLVKRLIIVGSPRSNGRSAHLAEMLFETCIDECPEDELYLAPVSELDIAGCIACDACKRAGEASAQAKLAGEEAAFAAQTGKGGRESESKGGSGSESENDADGEELPIPYCPRFDDDMLELYDVLFDVDELVIVSPVFFSGAPAALTALLDRLQPYFWEWLALRGAGDAGRALTARKRPATLHVIGEGLDKNGYVALVSKVRSAIAPAGFCLERVLDWVGKIAPDGTITDEAAEYRLPPLGTPLVAPETYLRAQDMANPSEETAIRERPKLNLHAAGAGGAGGAAGAGGVGGAGGKGKRPKKGGKRRG